MNRAWFREYFKTYYAKRKEEYIEILGAKCAECGSVNELEFHHTDPQEKKFNITHFLSYTKEKILLELKKCVLLCSTCHDKKTYKPRKHGTTRMYRIGCRCGLCSGANTQNMRQWRARKVGH